MKNYHSVTLVRFSLVILAVFALVVALPAQVQNGQLQGTVQDQSGAAVPNATVTVTNQGTSESFKAPTSGTGFYVINQVPVGQYSVKVEAPGFKTETTKNQTVNAGVIERLDFKLSVGQVSETVEVNEVATQVNTDDAKLQSTVAATQIQNLPLNGRNVYDLIKLAPGAADVRGVMTENGAGVVVNGVREDFNGFTVNGVSNKGLSGGNDNQPIEDTVQEFQELTQNMSAQYGNSAGSITNLVTKSGTNSFHGSGFEFIRNNALDANSFFNNQANQPRNPLHFNQFGGTFGGPIVKDKLFFFAAYQGDRFNTSAPPSPIVVESPQWRAAVASALPNSVAALLYNNFAPSPIGTPNQSIGDYVGGLQCLTPGPLDSKGFPTYNSTGCAPGAITPGTIATIRNGGSSGSGNGLDCGLNGLTQGGSGAVSVSSATNPNAPLASTNDWLTGANTDGNPLNRLGALVGPGMSFDPCTSSLPFNYNTISVFKQQVNSPLGNLFNGNEAELRLDYNMSDKNRFFTEFNWQKQTDQFGPGLTDSARGFTNPTKQLFPNFQFSFIHTFSSHILNEFKAGYVANVLLQRANIPGVPEAAFDDGSMGFGSYSGYPQFFKENVYTYSDVVSVNHGNHNMKVGVDFRRNLENSEFNVARPSYYFMDPIYFAADDPYGVSAGVDPGFVKSHANPNSAQDGLAQLSSNERHWRNLEFGTFFQDDWKVSRRLTLNLGLRYDLFKRHNEENGLATTFLKGPGNLVLDNITTGAGWLQEANTFNGTTNFGGGASPAQGTMCSPTIPNTQVLAGICGPGGFAAASSLGKGDHTDFGPRVGFAYDVFGDGKTSLRGGYGISYEGTLYNPLSNSRWNPPYYSFNSATSPLGGGSGTVVYGPQSASCGAPTFTGAPCPANRAGFFGAQATGNINGWGATNPDQAILTGIVLPSGIKDPYVHNFFLSVQRELVPKVILEVDYVGTAGHKLFRAEDINRLPGGRAPILTPTGAPDCFTDNFGRTLCGQKGGADNGRVNPNYGRLRNWQNVANSDYNALQTSLKTQSWHNLTFNLAYTYGHSIDNGSTWHSGATSSNGPGAGEGFTTDQTQPNLDRGNSIYDVRNRVVINYVYELPWFNHSSNAWAKNVLGGWQWNAIWSYQTGAHWEPWCSRSSSAKFRTEPGFATKVLTNTGCDFNLDSGANDRPNAAATNVDASHDMWALGWNNIANPAANYTLTGDGVIPGNGFFTKPCLGCTGNEGRNTFIGPNFFAADMSLFKSVHITERVNVQFRAESFNLFNRANFELPGANGATNNHVTQGSFGQAGGTFFPRQLQFGLKISF